MEKCLYMFARKKERENKRTCRHRECGEAGFSEKYNQKWDWS